jgi:hypothetical protein
MKPDRKCFYGNLWCFKRGKEIKKSREERLQRENLNPLDFSGKPTS